MGYKQMILETKLIEFRCFRSIHEVTKGKTGLYLLKISFFYRILILEIILGPTAGPQSSTESLRSALRAVL